MTGIKGIIKDFIPPILLRTLRRKRSKYGFFGDYPSWEEALKLCSGYDSNIILNKVKHALLKVKAGQAAYERDSVLFYDLEYPYPLLAGLMRVAAANGNSLNVLDFGGSLGSTYFQCRSFFEDLSSLRWNIVEQAHFVNCGREFFEDDVLKFYYNIDECRRDTTPDVTILSSVIPYLEEPYAFLHKLLEKNFKYIILDRTPFLHDQPDRITVQKVPPEIYNASYPAWLFNFRKLQEFFSQKYILIADFPSLDRANIPVDYRGCIFKLKATN